MKAQALILGLLTVVTTGHVHNAVETEMFAIPISPNLFNWTYQEFDQQYRFHAALMGKPELPSWLRYIYSGRHHSGFIFGTPPRGTKSPITLEVIGLNRQDYETRKVLLVLNVHRREKMAKHEVELKIDNLNVEDLLDEHRMTRLKDIFRGILWPESNHDLYPTFLASAIDLGARLPLKPSDGEGLVIRLGSIAPFSTSLKDLREEVRPLSKLPSCPREFKRTSQERLFRDAGLTLDWCSFELYNTVYRARTTEHVEYLTPIPSSKHTASHTLWAPTWSAPARDSLPTRGVAKQLAAAAAAPLLLLMLAIAALTATVCFHYAAMRDPESDHFLETIFHICSDYRRRRRAHKAGRVELCRYGTNTEQTQADNTSNKSAGVSPNNSLPRPYSPKSTTNLAANYNRPQPPPYGSATNTLHHRKSAADHTPSTSGHTPEHRHLALEDSLKLLNEANIANSLFENSKDPIVDLNDTGEDYVPVKPVLIKPDGIGFNLIKPDGYVAMKDLDDIDVPDLGKYGI
ncbi:alpha-sarcoglycan isoform X1 [Cydia fagiglandana]|uniref:alpha-sarcoglycan isoform X1 n=1 Tax=Cydia fagiglandana TaxID=1458189 RepID=UPI002FEDE89A